MTKKSPRKTRSDKGQVQLNYRDFDSLHWIAEQYAARLDQLQTLLGRKAGRGAKTEGVISENAARLVVSRWKRAHLAEYKRFVVEEPGWVWLTAHGLSELGLGYKAYEPSLGKQEHLFEVNVVRLRLEKADPDGTWRSERSLRAGVSYVKGDAPIHMPDATWKTEKGTAAIEVELSPKKPEVLHKILNALTSTYLQVWYYVTDETRHGILAARNHFDEITANSIHVFPLPRWEDDE